MDIKKDSENKDIENSEDNDTGIIIDVIINNDEDNYHDVNEDTGDNEFKGKIDSIENELPDGKNYIVNDGENNEIDDNYVIDDNDYNNDLDDYCDNDEIDCNNINANNVENECVEENYDLDYEEFEQYEKLTKKDILNIFKLLTSIIAVVSIILIFSRRDSFAGIILLFVSFLALIFMTIEDNE